MRAFLALPVLPPALESFRATRARLEARIEAVRWTPAESPHITLHFFGTITDADAAAAVDGLRAVFSAQPPLQLGLHGLGTFPPQGRPRVLWWGVQGDLDGLSALAAGCARTLAQAGHRVEPRPYRPHCTLGRPRTSWAAADAEQWRLCAAEAPATPRFLADRAVLYESVPGRDGVRHLPRITVPLGA